MAWFLNRGGQPEGPFEDGQLLQMIQAGQVQGGHHVSQPGSNQWTPVSQVPQFAQALGGGGYPAPPGVAPAGHAPAPGGMVAGAQPAGGPGGAPPKKKGAPIGLILGIVGVLVVAGAAVGLYFAFRGVSSNLSASVPKDTQIFVEVPSIPAALKSFSEMDILDGEKLKTDKVVEDMLKGLEEGFDIQEDEARSIMESVESLAVAAREVTEKPEVVVLVSFSDGSGIEALLKTERFEEEGDLGGGTQYSVERDETDYDKMKDWSPYRKAFATTSFDKDSKSEALVWFADQKLLVIGSKDLIEDVGGVVVKGEAALKGEEKWGQASYPSGASGIAFVDSDLLDSIDDEDAEKLVKQYFKDVGPFTASVRFTDAGIVYNVSGEMKGDKVKPENAFPEAAALDLYEKLPSETVGYISFSTKREGSGKELKERLLAEAEDVDEDVKEEAEKMLDAMEDELDFTIEEVLDALGEQGVLAVAFDREIEIDDDKKPEEWIEEGGVALVMHIADEEKAKKVVAALKEKGFEDGPLEESYEIEDQGAGFDATPKKDAAKMGMPSVMVRLGDGHLLVAAGGLANRFVEALEEGKSTLGGDGAHKAAIGALGGKPTAVLWADTGRVGKAVLDFIEKDDDRKDDIEEIEEELGLSIDAIRLDGDSRITSAVAFTLEPGDDRWGYQLEALNAEALGMMAGMATMLRPKSRFDDSGSGAFYLPDTGIPICDALAISKHSCGERTSDEALKAEGRSDEAHYKAALSANPSQKDKLSDECLQKHLAFIRENKQCSTTP